MSQLQFVPAKDFETIPYQPLNANEPSELRFQIKNPTQTRLHGVVRLIEAGCPDTNIFLKRLII